MVDPARIAMLVADECMFDVCPAVFDPPKTYAQAKGFLNESRLIFLPLARGPMVSPPRTTRVVESHEPAWRSIHSELSQTNHLHSILKRDVAQTEMTATVLSARRMSAPRQHYMGSRPPSRRSLLSHCEIDETSISAPSTRSDLHGTLWRQDADRHDVLDSRPEETSVGKRGSYTSNRSSEGSITVDHTHTSSRSTRGVLTASEPMFPPTASTPHSAFGAAIPRDEPHSHSRPSSLIYQQNTEATSMGEHKGASARHSPAANPLCSGFHPRSLYRTHSRRGSRFTESIAMSRDYSTTPLPGERNRCDGSSCSSTGSNRATRLPSGIQIFVQSPSTASNSTGRRPDSEQHSSTISGRFSEQSHGSSW